MDRLTVRGQILTGELYQFDELWNFADHSVIWAASSAGSGLITLTIGENAAPHTTLIEWMGTEDDPFTFGDLTTVPGHILVSDRTDGSVSLFLWSVDDGLDRQGHVMDQQGRPLRLDQMTTTTIGNSTFLLGSGPNQESLMLFELDLVRARAELVDVARDHPKSTLSGISDMVTTRIGESLFAITSSSTKDGLTSHLVTENGLELRDTLGPKDGLWINGMEDIALLAHLGQDFIVAVSAQSGTLSAIRINHLGAMFVTDIAMDDRTTRFDGAVALDVFEVNGRGFIVTGGTDGGVALFELLPGGALWHHQSAVQDSDWDIGNILSIAATVTGDNVEILLGGSQAGGLTRMTLPLASMGDIIRGNANGNTLGGTGGDDILFGYSGSDTLSGGSGDDTLFAGTGSDRLTGGSGADVFVFTADGQTDVITDFEKGEDRIHIGAWGMIYDVGALDIHERRWGAEISWRNEAIQVHSSDGAPIDPSSWTNDDFLF